MKFTQAEKDAARDLHQSLIRRGYHPKAARRMVLEGVARLVVARSAGVRKAAGVADAASDMLAQVVSKGNDVQAQHGALIATIPALQATGGSTTSLQDQLDGLQSDWVNWALPVVGVQYPYQLSKTDPAQAIVIAVRDDINDTISRLRANQIQEALAKEIKAVTSPFSQTGLPSLPKINIPWYVWAVGAAGIGWTLLRNR